MTDQPITIGNNLTVTGTISAGGTVFQSATASSVALTAKGVSGQTADIFEVQDFQGNVKANVTAAGVLHAQAGLVVDTVGETITAGNLGVGVAQQTDRVIYASGTSITSSAVTTYGMYSGVTFPSTTTTEGDGLFSAVTTAAAAFTMATAAGFHAGNATKGAGSTITNSYGFVSDAQTAGGTINAFYAVNSVTNPASSFRIIHVVSTGAGAMSLRAETTGSSPGSCDWQLFTTNGTTENATAAFKFDGNNSGFLNGGGDIVLGNGTAMANGATIGYVYISGGGGAATGVPGNNASGFAIRYNSASNTIQVYNGSWRSTPALT